MKAISPSWLKNKPVPNLRFEIILWYKTIMCISSSITFSHQFHIMAFISKCRSVTVFLLTKSFINNESKSLPNICQERTEFEALPCDYKHEHFFFRLID